MKQAILSALLCGSVFAAEHKTTPASAPVILDEPNRGGRTVIYGEHDVITLHCRQRFSCLIQVPKSEQIMDFVIGDKEFWTVNGAQNFAYVKPAKADSQTDLHLVTASGNVYSFLLIESAVYVPDLKVFIELRDGDSMATAVNGPPRFVPASQLDDYKAQVEIAQTAAQDAKKAAQTAIDRNAAEIDNSYPGKMKHAYRFKADEKPFNVSAVWNTDHQTIIEAAPEEVPALYEIRDGKPNLINFEFKDGKYTVDRILSDCYLQIGKKRLVIARKAETKS